MSATLSPTKKCSSPQEGHSLPTGSNFVIWEDIPQPLNTVNTTKPLIHAESQFSGSSVDKIIDHYGHQSSSAPNQAALCATERELASANVQNAAATKDNATTPALYQGAYLQDSVKSEGDLADTQDKVLRSRTALPSLNFHSSSPVHTVQPYLTAPVAKISASIPFHSHEEENKDVDDCGRPKVEDDASKTPRSSSEDIASDTESKVGQLVPPPARMNSTRRGQVLRARSSTASYNSNSFGGAMTEESDDDPFQYDQPSVFLKPSREREVSACLRQVSGLPRESTATVYSQDGTPSKTFYGNQYFVNDQPVSPGSRRLLDDLASIRSPTESPLDASSRHPQRPAPSSIGGRFYHTKALKSEWALGSPDVVKIPVQKQKGKENQFARGPSSHMKYGGATNEESDWAALHRTDEGHRMTGDTED